MGPTRADKSGQLLSRWILFYFVVVSGVIAHRMQQQYFDNTHSVNVEEESNWRRSRRWRRQVAPSEHILVYSMDSNVSISDWERVISSESRTQLMESHFNATIFSNSSLLIVDRSQDNLSLNASKGVVTDMRLNSAQIQTFANEIQLNCTTDRNAGAETRLTVAFLRNVNLSISDDQMTEAVQLQAVNGNAISAFAQSWDNPTVNTTRFSILSATGEGQNIRQLSVAVVSRTYQIQLNLESSEVSLTYGNNVQLNIASSYRTIVLRAGRQVIELYSQTSPFEVTITDRQLNINCMEDKTEINVLNNGSVFTLDTGQLSRIISNFTRGQNQLVDQSSNASSSAPVDKMELVSLESHLRLGDTPNISVQALHSQLTISSNSSQMRTVSAKHAIEISGNHPHLMLETGNITIAVSFQYGEVETATLIPQITTPSSLWISSIGPYASGHTAKHNESQIQEIPDDELPKLISRSRINSIGRTSRSTPGIAPSSSSSLPNLPTTDTPVSFPTPNPSIFATSQNVAPNHDAEASTHVTENIQRISTSTTTDNFVIGQFETTNEESATSARPVTPDSSLVPISATIVSVQVDNNTLDMTNSNATDGFDRPRRLRHLSQYENNDGFLDSRITENVEGYIPPQRTETIDFNLGISSSMPLNISIHGINDTINETSQRLLDESHHHGVKFRLSIVKKYKKNFRCNNNNAFTRIGANVVKNNGNNTAKETPNVDEKKKSDERGNHSFRILE
ncbi:hypothetical protein DdX_02080 [Ditylenchus destructor]|uniref:Uncharacterized protein n=1 Tax=Ditylenchus destructor TaxID=166010 RepID=A0AAD4NGZ0_9BILA|nr:hypothetical protein DdX_02080 [Ditylenchus destructor]